MKRISQLARSWRAARVSVAISLVLPFGSLALGEDGWQWRINKQADGRAVLAFSEFDAGDVSSGLSYFCKPSSGVVEVRGSMDKKQRQLFADLIRADSYPKIELEDESTLPDVLYSESSGWEYQFSINAESAAFNKFRQTGKFGFKITTIAVDYGKSKAGLAKISEFQRVCRAPNPPKVQR